MGCTQSRIENEEAVSRCKDRKLFMKAAVENRNQFAAAHSSYTVGLKSIGAALSDYGQGEVNENNINNSSTSSFLTNANDHIYHINNGITSNGNGNDHLSTPANQAPYDTQLPLPPPPLPIFSPSPLKRAATMPAIKVTKEMDSKDNDPILEDAEDDGSDSEEHEGDDEGGNAGNKNDLMRHRRSKTSVGGGDGSGIGGGTVRVGESVGGVGVKEIVTPVSPRTPPNDPLPPPPPDSKGNAWDFFFEGHVPGSSLINENDEIHEENGFVGMDSAYMNMNMHMGAGVGNGTGGESMFMNHQTESVVGGTGMTTPTSELDGPEPEPRTPVKAVELEAEKPVVKKTKQMAHSNSAPQDAAGGDGNNAGKRVVKSGVGGVSLLKVLHDLDDHFLKASESAHEVSKMLEATRLHYHSNFADNRGHINHSERVMRVITWNRSFRNMSNLDEGKDDFDSEEAETHATVLDKLLAWEKKLYEEVKAGEHMKLEYHRKVTLLNKQKKRGVSTESLERTKAAVSHLHTRYIVDMQSMDSTVSEINRLRDVQLYPKLVKLIGGMAQMWENMRIHHGAQQKTVANLRLVDISQAPRETSLIHHNATQQLLRVVKEWHTHFQELVQFQKDYIQALNNWLKLNVIPIESSLKEKVSSPPRVIQPAIQSLLQAWQENLDNLPAELAGNAISSFMGIVEIIKLSQEDELRLKEKCAETNAEFMKKTKAFQDWYHKYMQRRTPSEDNDQGEDPNKDEHVMERQFAVETIKKRLEEEVEEHQKHCKQVREKSLANLKTHLPELFRAMTEFSGASAEMYNMLHSISPPRNHTDSSP